jgi:hypothetical protein
MRRLSLFFFSLFFVISCKDKDQIPNDILPKEKMQEVLWDLINAGEFLNGYIMIKDSIDKTAESIKIYGQVFQLHHITKEEFDKSYLYYRERPALMKLVLDSLSKQQTISPGQGGYQRKEDSILRKALKDSARK